MREGHDVQVVSMYSESVAASKYLEHWVKSRSTGCNVHRHLFDLARDGNDTAVDTLVAAAKDGDLHVIVDEVDGRYIDIYLILYSQSARRSYQVERWKV